MHRRLLWGYEACLKVIRRGSIFRCYVCMMKKDNKLMKCLRKKSHAPETSLGLRGVYKGGSKRQDFPIKYTCNGKKNMIS